MSIKRILVTAAASGSLVVTAQAVVIYGLGSDSRLYSFDSSTPGIVTNIGPVSGLVDIDFHAVNGLLHGVAGNGLTYTVNTMTGVQTLVTTPLTALAGLTAMDFNPVVDRIRLVGSGNSNFRLTPNAQTPAAQQANGFVSVDGNYGVSGFNVLGVAYINPTDGATTTTLFSLGSNGFLYSHSVAPTFNTLTPVGSGLGFTPVGSGFDIDLLNNGYGYDGVNLQLINLNGSASSQGAIGLPQGVTLLGLAVVPEPSGVALAAIGALGAAGIRRRSQR